MVMLIANYEKKKGIMKLKVDDIEYVEDMEIAIAMNKHFQSVFTNESVLRSTVPLENVNVTGRRCRRAPRRPRPCGPAPPG